MIFSPIRESGKTVPKVNFVAPSPKVSFATLLLNDNEDLKPGAWNPPADGLEGTN